MRHLCAVAIALSLLATPATARTSANLFPWVLPWDDATKSVTNVSGWLEKPAGKHGFVKVRGGHLYAGNRRLRLLGTNITSGAAFPTHADAEKIAAHLAKFGINCVRFHHMDASWANPNIFAPDGHSLSPEQMDRLDYFIAQLKKHGIYTDLNLHVSREYPGAPQWDGMPSYFKGVDIFHPPTIAMQREYARQLLTHRNRYTGKRYLDEPAVAIVEVNNEDGLISQWNGGGLDDMSPPYADELGRQWNAWLRRRYGSEDALKRAWRVEQKPLGAEMLANGDFSNGQDRWVLEVSGTAKATAAATTDGTGGKSALSITISAVDGEGWHVQMDQPGLRFQRGAIYTLEFDARANARRTIIVDARQAHEPWETLWSANVTLSNEWQHFSFPVAPTASEDNGRVTFTNLGATIGTVEFASVSLRPGGGYKLHPGEGLGTMRIVKRSEFGALNDAMKADWIRFLYETESRYWTDMARYIKRDLGAKNLVVGTASGFSPSPMQAQLDVVDNHAYWQHPVFPGQPWDANNWYVRNTPMAGRADGGTLPPLGLSRIMGKPYIVTEYNHPAPATRNSEAFLLIAGYAGLQDWDGFFSFAYESDRERWASTMIDGYFNIDHHPTQMATMPAAAALFLRGDMASPGDGVFAATTPERAIAEVARFGTWFNAGNLGIGRSTALQRPVGLRLDGRPMPIGTPPPGPVLRSANGQWVWDSTPGRERVLINAPRSKALIGSTTGGPVALGGVTVAAGPNMQNWAAITLTAIDGRELSSRGRILVTATGYAENTRMGWKDAAKTTVGVDWGTGPTLVEGIPATITLPVSPARVEVWALDERGKRRQRVPVVSNGGKASFAIGPQYRTLWYEAVVR